MLFYSKGFLGNNEDLSSDPSHHIKSWCGPAHCGKHKGVWEMTMTEQNNQGPSLAPVCILTCIHVCAYTTHTNVKNSKNQVLKLKVWTLCQHQYCAPSRYVQPVVCLSTTNCEDRQECPSVGKRGDMMLVYFIFIIRHWSWRVLEETGRICQNK